MASEDIQALLNEIVNGAGPHEALDRYINATLAKPEEEEAPPVIPDETQHRSGNVAKTSHGGSFQQDENGYITGRAATFATPSDLRNFAATGSLATGDNGRGAFGHNTAETPGVAIPRDVLQAVYGSTAAAAGRPVEILLPSGQKTVLPIVDIAPRVENRANNAVIEFSGGAVKHLGLGDMNGVKYKFL